jgi:hypothetical protein
MVGWGEMGCEARWSEMRGVGERWGRARRYEAGAEKDQLCVKKGTLDCLIGAQTPGASRGRIKGRNGGQVGGRFLEGRRVSRTPAGIQLYPRMRPPSAAQTSSLTTIIMISER